MRLPDACAGSGKFGISPPGQKSDSNGPARGSPLFPSPSKRPVRRSVLGLERWEHLGTGLVQTRVPFACRPENQTFREQKGKGRRAASIRSVPGSDVTSPVQARISIIDQPRSARQENSPRRWGRDRTVGACSGCSGRARVRRFFRAFSSFQQVAATSRTNSFEPMIAPSLQ